MSRIVCFCLCLLSVLVIGHSSSALADKSNVPVLGHHGPSSVDIMLGKAEMVTIPGEAADILVANPDIVDVMAVKSNRLYLVGSSLGDTNIMALDDQGNIISKLNVHVQMDTEKLKMMIHELYPYENVQVRALTDQVVLTGEVSNPSVANKVTNLVGHYVSEIQETSDMSVDQLIVNMLKVRGEQQVMLRVKIVEASRNALKDLGLEANSAGGGNIGNLGLNAATSAALGLSSVSQLGIATLSYNSGGFGNLSYIARALEEEGIVNTLAEPNLTSISGEQAGFLAGGEFPIPTGVDRNGNLSYEFRPFGVSLNFRPVVMSENRISLQLTTEVSTTSFEQNLQLNGVNVPTFNVRRAETTVELPSGGTLMIAGLLQSDTISGLTKLPGVGDIPVVGDLVKSDTFQRDESEVVVIITPYLVKPFAQQNAVPARPNANHVDPSALSYVGPDMNYGAMVPSDIDFPQPERQKQKTDELFSDNIRRVYGKKTPKNLLRGEQPYGYMLD